MLPSRPTATPEISPAGWGPLATTLTLPCRTTCSSLLAPASPTRTPYFLETESWSGARTLVVSVLTRRGEPPDAAAMRVDAGRAPPAASAKEADACPSGFFTWAEAATERVVAAGAA